MKKQTLIDAIINCAVERDAEFLISIIEQFHDNPLLKLSEKQEMWLEAMADRNHDYPDAEIPW